MLQLVVLFAFFSSFVFSQGIKTTGNLKIKATGCVKIYVKGQAKFDTTTVLQGSADFQVTGGTNKKFEKTCDPVLFEGCQIKVYAGSWVHILMSNKEMGKVEVELFDLNGNGFYTLFEQTKTTPIWWHWVEIKDLPQATYFLQVKIKGEKYCGKKIANWDMNPPSCMNFFPNPVEDILTVQNLGAEINTDTLAYQIIDTQGRLMQTYHAQPVAEQTWQIRVSHLRKGLYIIRFRECKDKFVKL